MEDPRARRRKLTLDHLSRVQGQLQRLRAYIEEDRACEDVASLTTSIAKSFDALRARTLEGFVLHELLDGEVSDAQRARLARLIQLYKR